MTHLPDRYHEQHGADGTTWFVYYLPATTDDGKPGLVPCVVTPKDIAETSDLSALVAEREARLTAHPPEGFRIVSREEHKASWAAFGPPKKITAKDGSEWLYRGIDSDA